MKNCNTHTTILSHYYFSDKTLHQIVEKCGTANVHKRVYKMPETLYKLPRRYIYI